MFSPLQFLGLCPNVKNEKSQQRSECHATSNLQLQDIAGWFCPMLFHFPENTEESENA